jgi:prophage regulatory protein
MKQLTTPRQADTETGPDARSDRAIEPRLELRREPVTPLRLLRFPTIRERTGLSRSTIWRLERCGAFPRHRRISANTVAWLEDEVDVWIRERVAR